MSRFETSIPATYFDAIYAADSDPWRFAQSAYERDKYSATLAALPRAHYLSTLEIGCSIGVLTWQLAKRCDSLLAVDVAKGALDQAERRCATLRHVRFEQMSVPTGWPIGRFDLILLSEVVYYLDRGDVEQLAARVRGAMAPEGDIILVHWLGDTNYPLTGDEAAETFIAATAAFAQVWQQVRTPDYRLDVLRAHDHAPAATR